MPDSIDLNSVLTGANATFIAEMHARYLENPNSVDASWQSFFAELSDDASAVKGELEGASWQRQRSQVVGVAPEPGPANGKAAAKAPAANGAMSAEAMRAAGTDSIQAVTLIRAYRTRGHLAANLDPQLKMVSAFIDIRFWADRPPTLCGEKY